MPHGSSKALSPVCANSNRRTSRTSRTSLAVARATRQLTMRHRTPRAEQPTHHGAHAHDGGEAAHVLTHLHGNDQLTAPPRTKGTHLPGRPAQAAASLCPAIMVTLRPPSPLPARTASCHSSFQVTATRPSQPRVGAAGPGRAYFCAPGMPNLYPVSPRPAMPSLPACLTSRPFESNFFAAKKSLQKSRHATSVLPPWKRSSSPQP